MMQVRNKPTAHIVFTKPTLAMVDEMALADAAAGDKPDRSRLVRQLVTAEHKRRAAMADGAQRRGKK